MRYVTSALCAAVLIGLMGCSAMNSGSSGSSLPNVGGQSAAPDRVVDNWTPINFGGMESPIRPAYGRRASSPNRTARR